MTLTHLTYQNIQEGALAGLMAFYPSFSEEPHNPIEEANYLASLIKKHLRHNTNPPLLITSSTQPYAKVYSQLKGLIPPLEIIHLLRHNTVNPVVPLASWVTVKCLLSEWTGLPGAELIATLDILDDPTEGFASKYYQHWWIERGPSSPQDLLNFYSIHGKWKIYSPQKLLYSQVLFSTVQDPPTPEPPPENIPDPILIEEVPTDD